MQPSQIPGRVRNEVESYSFPSEGCWIWSGDVNQSGVPVIKHGSRLIPAKMAFYHFLHEELTDLEEGYGYRFYMGECDNKLCVKPEPFKHVVCRQGLKPGPRNKSRRKKVKQPWDRNRSLRIYYGHKNPEQLFEEELSSHVDTIENLILTLDLIADAQCPTCSGGCIEWDTVVENFNSMTGHDSSEEFTLLGNNRIMARRSHNAMYPLPVKRVLYNFWNEEEDYLLLPGFQRISNSCDNKHCYTPRHLQASVRTPGSRNAKTEWVTYDNNAAR